MSIVVSVKVSEGLVIAADSASTLQLFDGNIKGVAKVFYNAKKLVQFGEFPISIATWGTGNIGSRNISSIVSEFENINKGKKQENVLEFAKEFKEFVLKNYSDNYPEWNTKKDFPKLGILIGGYSEKKFFPELYQIKIPKDNEIKELRPKLDNENENFGANWFGSFDAINRFHFGYDAKIFDILKKYGIKEKELKEIHEIIQTEIQYNVPFDGMPLQDAVDYAIFLINLVIGRYRFVIGAPLCGGNVDVATITKEKGFSWINEKKIKIN